MQWAESYWQFLEFSAATANTPKRRKAFQTIWNVFEDVIPCPTCSANFIAFKQKFNINKYNSSAEQLLRLVWELHNDVNKRNGKPSYQWNKLKAKYKSIL